MKQLRTLFYNATIRISRRRVTGLIILFCLFGNTGFTQQAGIPAWALQSNIYEVNLRQYSASSSIKDFAKHLPRLKEMGVEILWFMPITPIGKEGRKMTEAELGSYYAVRNYKQVNEEFGNMADWKSLVKKAHGMGFKVITDWVPNHSAPDNPWIKNHPNFYAKDSAGNMVSPFDWTDVRKLDYSSRELRDSMIDAMKFWIRETGIDGYRCDVAGDVPTDFWRECITALKKIKNVYMLAEGENPALHEAGFNTTYTWSMMGAMADLYAGKKTLAGFDSVLNQNINTFPKDATRLYFTTNHDENSWNGTEFEKYGDAYKTFAVFTQTIYQSIPLIYSGQEIPNRKRLKFFVKDPITWTGKYEMAPFYRTLLKLRRSTPALAANAAYKRVATTHDDAIFAFTRMKDAHKVLIVLNFSAKSQQFSVNGAVAGKALNVFTNKSENVTGAFNIPAWGYRVYVYQ
jgi:glycosidase